MEKYNKKLLNELEDRFDKLQAYLFRSFDGEEDLYSFIASIIYDKDYKDCCEFNADGAFNPEGKELRDRAKQFILPVVIECGSATEGFDRIDTVPTVTSESPQGEWIVTTDKYNIQICKCSICGRIEVIKNYEFYKIPFCHCGAKMHGGEE